MISTNITTISALLLGIIFHEVKSAFLITPQRALKSNVAHPQTTSLPKNKALKSFVADGSDYSSTDSDYESDEDAYNNQGLKSAGFRPLAADEPATEESPVPTSKNALNRFIMFYYDKDVDVEGRSDVMEFHDDRVAANEDHVLFCRKANLYNETFNYNSMTDVVWSYPLLSTDLQRYVGHAMCLDSTSLDSAKDFLRQEPNIVRLTGGDSDGNGDLSNIHLFRWRHLKDHTLRRDMGRDGVPTLLINFDRMDDAVDGLRAATNTSHVQYLIQSERIIEAGPLHLPTSDKNDPESKAVGNLILFNALEREEAVEFAENDPCARAGLYETMRLHNFNVLDISGKFVVHNRYSDDNVDEMKEALEYWGYPVRDDQTPWINA